MSIAYVQTLPAAPHDGACWIRPVNLIAWDDPACSSGYYQLAGGWMAFADVDVIQPDGKGYCACRMSVADWLSQAADKAVAQAYLDRLTKPRPDFAGLSLSEPHIMAIVNVTPDSFSDGGAHFASDDAIAGAKAMAEEGASILDIGGESTRPGAEPVSQQEEMRRILPVIAALSQEGHIVSADTRHTAVMGEALKAGAPIINDVGGFRDYGAPEMMAAGYQMDAGKGFAIIMHMQGTPETMQQNPSYDFAPLDIYIWLEERIKIMQEAGLPLSHIAVDFGFGFGKTPEHNLQIIEWTSLFHGLGVPLLVGVSRKSTIAKLSNGEPADERLGGSLALTMKALHGGAQFYRVHDVSQSKQAISLYLAR